MDSPNATEGVGSRGRASARNSVGGSVGRSVGRAVGRRGIDFHRIAQLHTSCAQLHHVRAYTCTHYDRPGAAVFAETLREISQSLVLVSSRLLIRGPLGPPRFPSGSMCLHSSRRSPVVPFADLPCWILVSLGPAGRRYSNSGDSRPAECFQSRRTLKSTRLP